jgi:hypothetical protein
MVPLMLGNAETVVSGRFFSSYSSKIIVSTWAILYWTLSEGYEMLLVNGVGV